MDLILATTTPTVSFAVGQNAYGVKTPYRITTSHETLIRGREMKTDVKRLIRDHTLSYVVHISMPPDEAREASKHLAWVLSGTLTRPTDFRGEHINVVVMSGTGSAATLTNPNSIHVDQAVLHADITHISVIDTASDRTLASEAPTLK